MRRRGHVTSPSNHLFFNISAIFFTSCEESLFITSISLPASTTTMLESPTTLMRLFSVNTEQLSEFRNIARSFSGDRLLLSSGGKDVVDRLPASEVGPAEIARNDDAVFSPLHDAEINRDGFNRIEYLFLDIPRLAPHWTRCRPGSEPASGLKASTWPGEVC